MMSQPGKQTITIHILLNIEKGKNNEILSVDRIKREKKLFFFQKSHGKWGRETSSKTFYFSKSFIEGKSRSSAA